MKLALNWWQAVMNQYFKGMEQAGFDAKTPIYMASGLLTYGDQKREYLLCATHYLYDPVLSQNVSDKKCRAITIIAIACES